MKNSITKGIFNNSLGVLIIFFGINMCQSCIKKKNLPDYYMDENFRSYVDFPKGSYWIYEETLTGGKSDSIYLFEREYSTDRSGKYVDYNYDRIDLKFFRSYYKDTMVAAGGGGENTSLGFHYTEDSPYNVQYFSGAGGVKSIYDFTGYKTTYKDSLASYKVNAVDFKQVKVFEKQVKNYDRQPKIIYYAKNIGVIKKELFNGDVWELKKYFINK